MSVKRLQEAHKYANDLGVRLAVTNSLPGEREELVGPLIAVLRELIGDDKSAEWMVEEDWHKAFEQEREAVARRDDVLKGILDICERDTTGSPLIRGVIWHATRALADD